MNKKKKSDIEKELPVVDGQIKEKERDIKLKSDMDVSDLELQRNTLKEQIAENLKRSGSFPVRKIRFKPVFCLILLSAFHAEHLYNCFTGIFESIRTFHSGIPVCSAFVLNY